MADERFGPSARAIGHITVKQRIRMSSTMPSSRVYAAQPATTSMQRAQAAATVVAPPPMVSPRQAALDTLTAILQTVPLPKSGKFISAPRARNAALVLVEGLRQ